MKTIGNSILQEWVRKTAELTRPAQVEWLEGSAGEYRRLLAKAEKSGQLSPLNEQAFPGSYLHRSHPLDVARTEQCTFICTRTPEDAGPTNNWMAPAEAHASVDKLFEGAMAGKTLYVIPYLLGPPGSSFSKVGVELTDSVYVAVNMSIMTRMGDQALEHLGSSGDFIRGVHSIGTLDPQKRCICHFPEERSIYSINSGYGGNALLSKKCAALRIAGWLGKQEGWLAEHMLIMGITDPKGHKSYIAAAFPSSCGKTNLAMLKPSGKFSGYKIECVGDDIAWLKPGRDGRLYAMNPEAGFFGVAPGTNSKTNPNMMAAISRNTIFTNVALTRDRLPWWEGLDLPKNSRGMLDWQGKPWDPASGKKAAHPNARFTTPIRQCPVYSPEWENPEGVPISAILFGCRRSKLIPLVCESRDWNHGVYLGATLSSETTAAEAGAAGVVRRDPMAMLPFCGYNMGDYFGHWLEIGKALRQPPKIFRVNWFLKNEKGELIWPGFGENMRVMDWILRRCRNETPARETAIGLLPHAHDLDLEGLNPDKNSVHHLLKVEREEWRNASRRQTDFFSKFGGRVPGEFLAEQTALMERLKAKT